MKLASVTSTVAAEPQLLSGPATWKVTRPQAAPGTGGHPEVSSVCFDISHHTQVTFMAHLLSHAVHLKDKDSIVRSLSVGLSAWRTGSKISAIVNID